MAFNGNMSVQSDLGMGSNFHFNWQVSEAFYEDSSDKFDGESQICEN